MIGFPLALSKLSLSYLSLVYDWLYAIAMVGFSPVYL